MIVFYTFLIYFIINFIINAYIPIRVISKHYKYKYNPSTIKLVVQMDVDLNSNNCFKKIQIAEKSNSNNNCFKKVQITNKSSKLGLSNLNAIKPR